MKARKVIKAIERQRRKNNRNWMALVRLAIMTRPKKAKRILRRIGRRDQKVMKATRKLSKPR